MNKIQTYLNQTLSISPLAVFRICFGLLMFIAMIRFWINGWIEKFYLNPEFHFSYLGFEWIKPLGNWTYGLFAICAISSLFVALGFRYKISIVVFFLSFTYIELMDKSTYLNHYYFVSLVSFLLIFLPAHMNYSLDARMKGGCGQVPRWCIDSLKILIAFVYFYAGLAKLNSDWLIQAMPLKIWLPSTDIPLLNHLFQYDWGIYFFAWAGALYDLIIPFLLWNRKTRFFAFIIVVGFHLITSILFPIGMFPYLMILGTLVFFDHKTHARILTPVRNWVWSKEIRYTAKKRILSMVGGFIFLQALLPLRHLLYPGELFWTEQGYRFSWRVMLIDKVGYAQFKLINEDGSKFYVSNSDFLTPFQEKQMSTQPDFILEYAHHLKDIYKKRGYLVKEINVESYVALNGREGRAFIDPDENLLEHELSLAHKPWILPFTDAIKGL